MQEPTALDTAKSLDFVIYAGGPLSSETGNKLSLVTDVCQFYGSTEAGPSQALVPRREDWDWIEWHPGYGADMQPSEDESYELVLHGAPDLRPIRCLDCNFRDIDKWRTKDVFRPHPTKPGLWKFHGRLDDIIVMSNGCKFNPVPSEIMIGAHSLLSGALIVGQGRFLASLLIEPRDGGRNSPSTLIGEVWPLIEQANAQAPGQARIIRSMVMVANGDKRFERAGKGTIIRGLTTRKFAAEISALYSTDVLNEAAPALTTWNDLRLVQDHVRACIELSFSVPDLKDDQDLYVSGLDSLKTIEIAKILRAGIKGIDTRWLSSQLIYAHSTVEKLARSIFETLNEHAGAGELHFKELQPQRKAKMATLVDEVTRNLENKLSISTAPLRTAQRGVLLTGSTGSLGTHLLRALIEDVSISKITCLNRSANSRERQKHIFASLGIEYDPSAWSKVEFFQANYGESNLGMPEPRYYELCASIDVIIHNAWKVDFHQSIESFTQVHIKGVRNLVDFCTASNRKPHFIFLSSISSVGLWNTAYPQQLVPEEIISDFEVAQKMGYAESKLVAENILHIASGATGISASILRVGQIAGPIHWAGVWNENEWFPSLIRTSRSLGALPNFVPDPDWIPVDQLAHIILDIARGPIPIHRASVYNLVNPHTTSWKSLTAPILAHLGSQMRVVSPDEWLQMLDCVDQRDIEELCDKPAAKIIEFFKRLLTTKNDEAVRYSVAKAIAASRTMAELTPVNPHWVELWLKQWGY